MVFIIEYYLLLFLENVSIGVYNRVSLASLNEKGMSYSVRL